MKLYVTRSRSVAYLKNIAAFFITVFLLSFFLVVWQHDSPSPSLPAPLSITIYDQKPLALNDQRRTSAQPNATKQCARQHHNIVYIKTHKTGSETLAGIFRRFGYVRNLSFVLPTGARDQLGWPYALEESFYRPSKIAEEKDAKMTSATKFNILCEHVVYGETLLRRIMPSDTIYVTSIRQPLARLSSAWSYYPFANILNITSDNCSLMTVLSNLDHFMAIDNYLFHFNIQLLRNSVAFDLGYKLDFETRSSRTEVQKKAEVRYFINRIKDRFQLVVLLEYFDESLVLLKRMMCWSWKDVLYFRQNVRGKGKESCLPPRGEEIYRRWSWVDFEIYEEFLNVFKQRVAEAGELFVAEVSYLRKILSEAEEFCRIRPKAGDSLANISKVFPPMPPVSEGFNFSTADCLLLDKHLLEELKSEYDRLPDIFGNSIRVK